MAKGAKKSPSFVEQSRDIYGFVVSSHHLQRYREFASIYQKEETERSERWELFLRTYSKDGLAELASGTGNSEEQVNNNGSEKIDCSDNAGENILDVDIEHSNGAKNLKGDQSTLHTWSPVRPSLKVLEQALRKPPSNSSSLNRPQLGVVPGVDKTISQSENGHLEFAEGDKSFATENTKEAYLDAETSLEAMQPTVSAGSSPSNSESLCPAEELAARDELKFLVRGGVPMAFRGEMWQVFVGTMARRVDGHYNSLLHKSSCSRHTDSGVIEKWTSQIEKDLPRTFPGHPALDKDARNALRRLLTAYARHNPDVGYCQAMNFFAALLLLLMPEENAFWTLTAVMEDYFQGYFSERMLEAQVDQLVLEELAREYFPKLIKHLDALGIQVAWISAPWFLSIFVNMLPWESVLRVWDVLLFEGNRCMLFRTALALLELYAPFIMAAHDIGDALSLLQSRTASTFDSSQLVLTACMGFQEINESKLEILRLKYRPEVLATVDERIEELRSWKSSQKAIAKKFSETMICESAATGVNGTRDNQHFMGKEGMSELLEGTEQNESLPYFQHSELDPQEQVFLLKKELCTALEEKKEAVRRAEELEIALLELVKGDNRHLLSAKLEKLEVEVATLSQALLEKKKREEVLLETISTMEKEQAVIKDACRSAEQDAAAQRYAANLMQEKYEEAVEALEKMEQRAILAESTLEATLQYQALDGGIVSPHCTCFASNAKRNDSNKAGSALKSNSSQQHLRGRNEPRDFSQVQNLSALDSAQDQGNDPVMRKQGMFSRAFGLNWGDRGKVH